jgi:hypothetical protein
VAIVRLKAALLAAALCATARSARADCPEGTPQGNLSGFELMTLAGLRTMTRIVHARIEAGVTRSTSGAAEPKPGGRRATA